MFKILVGASLIYAILAGLCLSTVSCTSASRPLQTLPAFDYSRCSSPASVTSSTELSRSEGKAQVYKLRRLQVDESFVVDLAAKLGINASVAREARGAYDTFNADDGNALLFVDAASGAILYRLDVPLDKESDSQTIVADSEAEAKADVFLSDISLHPQASVESSVSDTSTGIEVRFDPADIPLEGSPSSDSIVVTLDKNGGVWGMSYQWSEPEPIGDYPIISETGALDRIRDCEVFYAMISSQVVATDVQLTYLAIPIDVPDYLVPVYKVSDVGQNGVRSQLAFVPAVKDQYLMWSQKSALPTTPTTSSSNTSSAAALQ